MSKDKQSQDWTGKRIDFPQFAADLARRREELGDVAAVPRNSGERRTPSKRALLEAIEATGKRW